MNYQYDSLYDGQYSRWEQSGSVREYLTSLWYDFMDYVVVYCNVQTLKEALNYFIDKFTISITVSIYLSPILCLDGSLPHTYVSRWKISSLASPFSLSSGERLRLSLPLNTLVTLLVLCLLL